jgi:hypothetical protein
MSEPPAAPRSPSPPPAWAIASVGAVAALAMLGWGVS